MGNEHAQAVQVAATVQTGPANDIIMRVWLSGHNEPMTYVLAIEAYTAFEEQYSDWRCGRSERSEAVMLAAVGPPVMLAFADIVVRQMTTRVEYENNPSGAFQSLQELTEEYARNMRGKSPR